MKLHRSTALALVIVAGCSAGAKVDDAKAYVQQALEVWQSGGKAESLTSRSPAIEFHEAMWNAGEKLVRFEMGGAQYVPRDNLVRCETRLTLRNRKGKEHTEGVTFDVVSMEPTVKIVNNPMP